MNWYSFLADLIVVVHFGYVSFVVLGLLVVLIGGGFGWQFVRNFWFRILHLAMILIVVAESLLGIICPLTVWEYNLRVAAGQQDVSDVSFIARTIHNLMFFDVSMTFLTCCYCLFGLAVIASWWFVPPRWKKVKTV
ncbi:hypothetical protein FACS1894170_04570 [Planctomycetales bacterium]|nr:hypothetical protein FACS1894170_04570 [Planctomycetales bacterium]